MPEELQSAIEEINEKDCQSAFEHDILRLVEQLSDENGDLAEEEQKLIEWLIRLSEAWMIVANTQVQAALLRLWIEASELSCSEELVKEELDQPWFLTEEVNRELQEKLESAINGLFGSTSISELFWWEWQEVSFTEKYFDIILWFSENDFMFDLSTEEINKALQFLRDNGISRNYSVVDRRENYVLGIVAQEIEERWIVVEVIPSYERNLTQRVYPTLDRFDRDGVHPELESFLEADELIDDSNLVLLDSPLWTLDSSILRKSQIDGQQWLVYGDPSLRVLMHVIIEELTERNVDYTPNIWSILRPRPYNRSLPWASNRSPHLRWIWIDLDLGSLDLENILKELDSAWYIVLTIESDHYHITLVNPEGITEDYWSIVPETLQEEDVDRWYILELFWETVNSQLGDELGVLFIDSLWGKVQENPLEYISSEWRIFWGHAFLYPLFKDFWEWLSPGLRDELETKTLDIGIFFRISSWPLLRWSRRIHFGELLSPIVYSESDVFSRELQNEGTVSDLEFMHSARALLDASLFTGSNIWEIINRWSLEENLTVFFRFFMHIESNFRNVANEWDFEFRSSAKWFYQEINGVIDGIENTSIYNVDEWRFTTFQSDLNRVMALSDLLPEEGEYVYIDSLINHRIQAFASNTHSPQSLSAAEQTLLILSSLLHKARSNTELEYLLQRVLVFGDLEAMRIIYAEFHHTDSSHRATSNRVNDILPLYANDIVTPESSEVIVDYNIWLQLSALIWSPTASESEISWFRAQLLQRFLLLLWYEVSDLDFNGDMVSSFGPSTKNALTAFQIDNELITSENDSSAGKFWPGTKRILQELVLERIEEIKQIDDEFIWPPLPPGLRKSDILEVFSR